MEDRKIEIAGESSNESNEEEEIQERKWQKHFRELRITRMRASVVRDQLIKTYQIIENTRWDYLSDTVLRDGVTRAKRELEALADDFMLSDNYWEGKIKEFRKVSPKEYAKSEATNL